MVLKNIKEAQVCDSKHTFLTCSPQLLACYMHRAVDSPIIILQIA